MKRLRKLYLLKPLSFMREFKPRGQLVTLCFFPWGEKFRHHFFLQKILNDDCLFSFSNSFIYIHIYASIFLIVRYLYIPKTSLSLMLYIIPWMCAWQLVRHESSEWSGPVSVLRWSQVLREVGNQIIKDHFPVRMGVTASWGWPDVHGRKGSIF
jgi:hypothetical protein